MYGDQSGDFVCGCWDLKDTVLSQLLPSGAGHQI